jgi:MFS family permease
MIPDPTTSLRRGVYALLIVTAVFAAAGRVLSVERVYEPSLYREEDDPNSPRPAWPRTRPDPMPTLRSNDRSRWATVRALVDDGTYVIGHRDPALKGPDNKYGDGGIVREPSWDTVDKVLRPDTQDFYSSKPPLLATLVAGEYWILKKAFGWEITGKVSRWWVVRTILLVNNVLPLLLYLGLLSRLADRFGATDWGRLFVITVAAFGTFLTTFAITLNNHSVATLSALIALYALVRIWEQPALVPGSWYVLAGFLGAFTACTELPAASFLAGLFLLLLWRAPRRTLLWFLPAAVLPVAAFFWTNYLAIGQLTPAYGELGKEGSEWYAYPGSHWVPDPGKEKHGIDWAFTKEDRATYVFHFLFGHHGVFSLSPVWLLAVVGMVWGLIYLSRWKKIAPDPEDVVPIEKRRTWAVVAILTLGISVIVVGFYLLRPLWNYGGWTSGPRWLMWLTPFWLVTMLPAADWMGRRRWSRGVAYLLLGFSVLAASFPSWTPWRQPWLYSLIESITGRAIY